MDVEQMSVAAAEEYDKNYSTGVYCHEQSFLWGFQEGVEFMESESKSLSGNIVKTKYNIGDEVWFMFQGKVQSGYIVSITVYRDCVIYNMRANCLSFKESLLFLTKEELLKSL